MIGTLHFLPPNINPNDVLPFILDGQTTLAAAVGSTSSVATSKLLSSYVGVILALGVTVRGVPEYEYTGDINFSLLLNESPFISNGQGTWSTQRGSVASPMPTFIRLPLGANSITFRATRTAVSAVPHTIAVLATGVMWPNNPSIQTDAARFRI